MPSEHAAGGAVVSASSLAALRAGVHGCVLTPADAGYAGAAEIWNRAAQCRAGAAGHHHRHPARWSPLAPWCVVSLTVKLVIATEPVPMSVNVTVFADGGASGRWVPKSNSSG